MSGYDKAAIERALDLTAVRLAAALGLDSIVIQAFYGSAPAASGDGSVAALAVGAHNWTPPHAESWGAAHLQAALAAEEASLCDCPRCSRRRQRIKTALDALSELTGNDLTRAPDGGLH